MAKVIFNFVRLDFTQKENPKVIRRVNECTFDDTQSEVRELLDVLKTGVPCDVPGLQDCKVSRPIITGGMPGSFQFLRDGKIIAQVLFAKNNESRNALEAELLREIAIETLGSLPQAPVAVICVLCDLTPGVDEYLGPAAAAGLSNLIH